LKGRRNLLEKTRETNQLTFYSLDVNEKVFSKIGKFSQPKNK
jgi:hypothetical protein